MTAPLTVPRRRPGSPGRRPPVERDGRDRRPDLRVVGPAPRRRRAGLVGGLAVLAVFGALFANAMFHAVLVTGQERLDRLEGQVAQEQARNQRLRLEAATLESPQHIVGAAQADGMVVPDETHWLAPRPGSGTGTDALTSTDERAVDAPATEDDPAAGTPEPG